MAYGFNIRAMIKVILKKILGSTTPLILYTDSKFFYDYFLKLGTIQKI